MLKLMIWLVGIPLLMILGGCICLMALAGVFGILRRLLFGGR